jgi:hypothetical protein
MDIEEYKKIKHEIDETIASIFEEFSGAINLFKNNEGFMRMRLLIAFSFAEVVCGVFDKYFNLNLGPTLLMKKWFKEYCLTETNKVFKNHQYFKKIDEEYLYQLRCSIIHAFALPEYKKGFAVMFPNGIETAENMQKMDRGFTQAGIDPIFISSDSLMQLFLEGFVLLHAQIFVPENTLTDEDYKGMERIYKEFYRRGAKPIPLL